MALSQLSKGKYRSARIGRLPIGRDGGHGTSRHHTDRLSSDTGIHCLIQLAFGTIQELHLTTVCRSVRYLGDTILALDLL